MAVGVRVIGVRVIALAYNAWHKTRNKSCTMFVSLLCQLCGIAPTPVMLWNDGRPRGIPRGYIGLRSPLGAHVYRNVSTFRNGKSTLLQGKTMAGQWLIRFSEKKIIRIFNVHVSF